MSPAHRERKRECDFMKKTVKPIAWTVILFGAVAVLYVITSIAEFISTGSTSAAAIALDALAFIGFGIFLTRYLG